jgi:hypothetical protein
MKDSEARSERIGIPAGAYHQNIVRFSNVDRLWRRIQHLGTLFRRH